MLNTRSTGVSARSVMDSLLEYNICSFHSLTIPIGTELNDWIQFNNFLLECNNIPNKEKYLLSHELMFRKGLKTATRSFRILI
jgi:hypothetical protein